MKVTYEKEPIDFCDYHAERVIHITTLAGEELIKFNLLDKDRNHLCTVTEKPDNAPIEVSEDNLTSEEIKEIAGVLNEMYPEVEWEEEDLEDTLWVFGLQITRNESLLEYSRRFDTQVVQYDFTSTDEVLEDDEEVCELEFFEEHLTDAVIIENILIPKILEYDGLDTIILKIIQGGILRCYRLMIKKMIGD
ncbi:hypothetical protein [Candidatus Enterococcus murrayae]|uniref:Uncharacterized protein n=1 Tax=Candidatus Enterococcus murrayae TaxID=2815321 RepID=A0ABS3HFM8_9ENTE|nr:hypothetical protein [Enterococcus sp. MJM16]MBO0452254.1 hypothetical protein [Enterococcus sp. MJM16]